MGGQVGNRLETAYGNKFESLVALKRNDGPASLFVVSPRFAPSGKPADRR